METDGDDIRSRVTGVVCRPAFVVAVGLLLVNDHLLKGAGVAPAWLVGKLSDVAGLFFFPVLLTVAGTVVLGLRRRPEVRGFSLWATLATLAVFGFSNVSSVFAGWFGQYWGSITVDPTDLLCLPMAVLGHAWLLGQIDEGGGVRPGRFGRFAMVGVAALASIATSKIEPTPTFEIRNEIDDSLGFVSSTASVVTHGPDQKIERLRIDGSGSKTLVPKGHWLVSMSYDSETLLVAKDSEHFLYREERPKLEALTDRPGSLRRASVSPGGRYVALQYAREPEDAGWWFGEKKVAVDLLDTEMMEGEESRGGWDGFLYRLFRGPGGWARYVRLSEDRQFRYRVTDEKWEEVSVGDVRAARPPGGRHGRRKTCEHESGTWKVERAGRRGLEGLKIGKSDGSSDRLVDLEITEKLDEGKKYRSPVEQFFFVGGCDYVVVKIAPKGEYWVVGARSKKIGKLTPAPRVRPVRASRR